MMLESYFWSWKCQKKFIAVLQPQPEGQQNFKPCCVISNFIRNFPTSDFQNFSTSRNFKVNSIMYIGQEFRVIHHHVKIIFPDCHGKQLTKSMSLNEVNDENYSSTSKVFRFRTTSSRRKYSIYGINEVSVQPKYRKFLISKV